ncbi:hypothetical protein RND81_04G018600 [Saponaria officinalis]|uniref:rRNA N-glycosylase n=1 Tax=Saponaria officinalis TaxID=3572 RepID=A0AAW1LGV3_SAPOF
MKSCTIVAIIWVVLRSSASIANAIALDLTNPTEDKYSTFHTDIRTNVADSKLKYGDTDIPVIGAPTNTYLRIDLQSSTGTVSLGLKRDDLFVVAYLAKNDQNKDRAYYFDGQISSPQLDTLFPEAKSATNQQKITEYTENYGSVQNAAGATRKDARGIDKLVAYTEGVRGKARSVQDEAKFVLAAIQIVSEGARFVYIQNLVFENFSNGFIPDDKVFLLEKNWNKISEAIKGSNNGVFSPPLVLKSHTISTVWMVNNATELNMGLLMYLG